MQYKIDRGKFLADQRRRAAYIARMEAGCLVCRTAAPGRVCPDCNLCLACGDGCDECAEFRRPTP